MYYGNEGESYNVPEPIPTAMYELNESYIAGLKTGYKAGIDVGFDIGFSEGQNMCSNFGRSVNRKDCLYEGKPYSPGAKIYPGGKCLSCYSDSIWRSC